MFHLSFVGLQHLHILFVHQDPHDLGDQFFLLLKFPPFLGQTVHIDEINDIGQGLTVLGHLVQSLDDRLEDALHDEVFHQLRHLLDDVAHQDDVAAEDVGVTQQVFAHPHHGGVCDVPGVGGGAQRLQTGVFSDEGLAEEFEAGGNHEGHLGGLYGLPLVAEGAQLDLLAQVVHVDLQEVEDFLGDLEIGEEGVRFG